MLKKDDPYKASLAGAFLGSIKFYDASKVLPKILKVDETKKRYQRMSERCIVMCRFLSTGYDHQIEIRFGHYYGYRDGNRGGYWVIETMSGTIEVLSWAKIKVIVPDDKK